MQSPVKVLGQVLHHAPSHGGCTLRSWAPLAGDGRCALPLPQEDIGDALGLTSVHVNRVIARLRQNGLIEIGRGELHVQNMPGLRRAGGFNPSYLTPWIADSSARLPAKLAVSAARC